MLLNVAEATQLLRCYQLPIQIVEAVNYLSCLRRSKQLLCLYSHFFPEEYAKSIAITTIELGKSYSERELEFVKLVNSRLFPIFESYWYEEEAEEEIGFFDYIPIQLDRVDWFQYFCEWQLGWQMLLVIEGTIFEEHHPEAIAAESKVLEWAIAQVGEPHQVDDKQLEARCNTASPPLTYLPLAVAQIQYRTGNIWLDIVPEHGWDLGGIEWTIENVCRSGRSVTGGGTSHG